MRISGSGFIVTGGASGLGEAAAHAIAQRDGKVLVCDLSQPVAEQRYITTDIADEASAKAAVDLTIAEFGALHGLVNCAGILIAQKVLGKDGVHPLDAFAKVMTVNVNGTFNMLRLAAEAMTRNDPNPAGERGVVINVSSIAAFDGQIGQAAYAASKGAIAAMTLPLAREFARWGIRVVTIAPGLFDTPIVSRLTAEARSALEGATVFPRRLGRPEEFAALALHIFENEMLNGEVIRLDGALRMAPK
jgi:NAD(P)-dependent dehydrogenase (short-subunit alcohol dehydrogenase family)